MSRRTGRRTITLAVAVVICFGLTCAAFAAETAAVKVESTAAAAQIVKLPAPMTSGGMALNDTLTKRRTYRSPGGPALSNEQLSQLMWAAQGITDPKTGHRTAPSAMAKYPIDVYAVTPDGIFTYMPADHSMKMVKEGDHRTEVTSGWAAKAPLVIVLVGVAERFGRPGERSTMWTAYEAGAVAQNVLLEATAMGLGAGTVAGFSPQKVTELCGLPEGQQPIIALPVGAMAAAAPEKAESGK